MNQNSFFFSLFKHLRGWLRNHPHTKSFLLQALRVYLLTGILLYFWQDLMLFHLRKIEPETLVEAQKNEHLSPYSLISQDGAKLEGWWYDKPSHGSGSSQAILLYFWGNAEEITETALNWPFQNFSFIALNYRGYGASAGRPSEALLKSDAIELYDALVQKEGISPSNIHLMGWSLGTGIAAHVASMRSAASMTLMMPYDSVAAVAKEMLPIYPTDLLLKNRFDTLSIISNIHIPLFILWAEHDRVIPLPHAKNLASHASSLQEMYTIPNGVHQDSYYDFEAKERIEKFIGAIQANSQKNLAALPK